MPLTDDERHRVALPGRADPVPDRTAGALLAVSALSTWWPGQAAPTLDGLDLEMRPGDVVSITGRNGAGKTTLLRILGGLVAPDSGNVRLGDIALGQRRSAYQRQIGLLTPGDRGLYARMTVQGNLDLWARMALLDATERAAAIAYSSRRFALAELNDIRVERLSMGQRQRLRLALAFLHEPRLVLLDEPATSLDSDALALLRSAVDDLAERGGLCIAVAPEGAESGMHRGDRLILRDGRLERPS
jgi:ABC-type multidrug transport system ATPase subunit